MGKRGVRLLKSASNTENKDNVISLIRSDILIIEDEEDIRRTMELVLRDEGYQTRCASNSIDGIAELHSRCPHLVILDIWLGNQERDGITILEQIKKEHPFLPVIMISGHATIEKAVASLRKGAFDFLEKPFSLEKLLLIVDRALTQSRIQNQIEDFEKHGNYIDVVLSGVSPTTQNLCATLERIAPQNHPIFISGPLGAGHYDVARTIHRLSPRRLSAFKHIVLSGADQLHLESFIFGLEVKQLQRHKNIGVLEQYHLSTVFFDEVTLLSKNIQRRLIKYIQTGHFTCVGGNEEIESNVRIIFSSQRSDQALESALIPELYVLCRQYEISLPSLEDRFKDIGDMVQTIINQYCRMLHIVPKRMDPEAIRFFENHKWPANLFQLRLIVQWMVLMGLESDVISLQHLPQEFYQLAEQTQYLHLPLREAREHFEKDFLLHHMSKHDFNVQNVAHAIGMERTALYRKLKTLGILG